MRRVRGAFVLCALVAVACGTDKTTKESAAESSAGSPVVVEGWACGALVSGPGGTGLLESLRRRIMPTFGIHTQIALWKPAAWDRDTTLRVRFLDHEPLGASVMAIANEWIDGLSVQFTVVAVEPADIRVSFTGGLESRIGKGARSVAPGNATLQLGGFLAAANDIERRAFVLHEFGHALGALHEHQRRDAPLTWRRTVVYKYYLDHYGMGPDAVDQNVIAPMQQTSLVQSPGFDPNSVMMYPLLKEFTEEGFVQPWNSSLTSWDHKVMRDLYGK